MDCLSLWIGCEQTSSYKELMTWILHTTPNAPKSCIIQNMLGENTHKV